MDSGQDYLESEILRAGKGLLELMRRNLCPAYVRDREHILLTAPWEESDFRVGIYLYDIQDYSLAGGQETAEGEDGIRFPPKAVELSYMLFCNEKRRFGGVQREPMQEILNEIARTVYDNPLLESGSGGPVGLSFLREDVEFKIRLWGSFSQPLQPAVYLRAAPVLITSRRVRRAARVREREYGVDKI